MFQQSPAVWTPVFVMPRPRASLTALRRRGALASAAGQWRRSMLHGPSSLDLDFPTPSLEIRTPLESREEENER